MTVEKACGELHDNLAKFLSNYRREAGPVPDTADLKNFTEGLLIDTLPSPGRLRPLVELIGYDNFYTDPASCRYHAAFQGGLALHSLSVLSNLADLVPKFLPPSTRSRETGEDPVYFSGLVLGTLFHDICKAGSYIVDSRNTKDERGNWIKVPYYRYADDHTSLGHGGESIARIMDWFPGLPNPWRYAVYHHMGAFGLTSGDEITYSNACRRYPEVLLLHTADMFSTCYHF